MHIGSNLLKAIPLGFLGHLGELVLLAATPIATLAAALILYRLRRGPNN